MKVLDLFSGIGGFSLGLERAGMQTVAFCEIEEFPRKIIKKHWPNIPCYRDIRDLTYKDLVDDNIEKIDVICGGFPCQDISNSGRKEGITGRRSGLWSEYLRLIGEVGPRWVIIENVPALRSRGFVTVLQDISSLGYDAEWHCIPASHFGAPHQRDRIWIMAYPNSSHEQRGGLPGGIHTQHPYFNCRCDSFREETSQFWKSEPCVDRVVNGVPHQMDRLKSLGNALLPQIAEMIGRRIMEVGG